jgi:hypothetical protein
MFTLVSSSTHRLKPQSQAHARQIFLCIGPCEASSAIYQVTDSKYTVRNPAPGAVDRRAISHIDRHIRIFTPCAIAQIHTTVPTANML